MTWSLITQNNLLVFYDTNIDLKKDQTIAEVFTRGRIRE